MPFYLASGRPSSQIRPENRRETDDPSGRRLVEPGVSCPVRRGDLLIGTLFVDPETPDTIKVTRIDDHPVSVSSGPGYRVVSFGPETLLEKCDFIVIDQYNGAKVVVIYQPSPDFAEVEAEPQAKTAG